ncbi:MAG TPA: ATP-binding protein [Actinomycetota bacterium]
MAPATHLPIRYWLRSVRIGLLVTVLVIAVLMLLPFLPNEAHIQIVPYLGVLTAGAAGGVVIGLLPWERLFERGVGMYFLYGWSAVDILLVSVGIAVSGGGRSEMFLIYGLTTVFFGISYPLAGQAGLLAFTFACYLAALGATGWDVDAAALVARLSSLGILAVLTSFLSRELMVQVSAQERSRQNAERWAALLSTVAESAHSMTLDPERVFEVALDSILGLGFHRGAICVLDEDGRTYRVLQAHGLPPDVAARLDPAALAVTSLVLQTGKPVVVDDERWEGALPLVQDADLVSMVAAPIWAEGWLQAVLLGGGRELQHVSDRELEAFQLLGAQAGMALQNARQFEAEHRTVERLEELDQLKNDFLATVSHELRTPVTVIQGSGLTLERMWDSLDDKTRRDLLGGLTSNARVLHDLITNLLDLSRLEAGHPQTFGRTNVSDLLLGTVDRLALLLVDHPLQVEVERGLIVEADPILIERVAENLLTNAVKHTQPGTRVKLSAGQVNSSVVVTVEDEGPGIPDEELAHVGERFFRGGEINTRQRGLGLGLAIASEILELHGSQLEVDSEVGRGTRFSFRLPLRGAERISPPLRYGT